MTIASIKQLNYSIREIADMLQRSASKLRRELSRISEQGIYASLRAQQSCLQHPRRGRPACILHPQSILFGVVGTLLCSRWSQAQIAQALAQLFPKGHALRVSHEPIYNRINVQPVRGLRKELVSNFRQARNKRTPCSKGQNRRGQIPGMHSIYVRQPEVEDLQFHGHCEVDLIKSEGNVNDVGTLVERTSRLLMLVKLPHPKPASAATVLQAFTDKLCAIVQPLLKSLTYDQSKEMALHKQLTVNSGIALYFCDTRSPWPRGSNEKTNGLVRQYLPNRTDLSIYTREQLDAIAKEINNRPLKGGDYDPPWRSIGSCS